MTWVMNLGMWLATVLVVLYLLSALLATVMGFIWTASPARKPRSQMALVDATIRSVQKPEARRQELLALPLVPSVALAWPTVRAPDFNRRRNDLQFGAKQAQKPLHAKTSATTAAALLIIVALYHVGLLWDPIYKVAVATLLFATVARHLGYLLLNLPRLLRRSRWNPILTLAVIAVTDGVLLAVALTALRASSADALTLAALRASAADLFDVTEVISALTDFQAPSIEAIPGIIFYAAIISATKNLKDFARSDEDSIWLASTALNSGDYSQAEKWLSSVSKYGPEQQTLKARLALASGRYRQAVDFQRKALSASGEDDSREGATAELAGFLIYTPLHDDGCFNFVTWLMAERMNDALVLLAVQNSLPAVDDAPDYAGRLLAIGELSSFPLTESFLIGLTGDWATACRIVDTARPGSEPEEFVRLLNTCLYRFLDLDLTVEDTHAYLVRWQSESLPVLASLVEQLSGAYRRTCLIAVIDGRASVSNFYEKYYSSAAPETQDVGLRLIAEFEGIEAELANSGEELQRLRGMIQGQHAVLKV